MPVLAGSFVPRALRARSWLVRQSARLASGCVYLTPPSDVGGTIRASADARRSACDTLPLRLGFDFGSRGYSDTPYAVGPEGYDPNLHEAPLGA